MPPLPPSWDGFHPLVVHFPIAIFVLSPLFLLLAGVTGKRSFMVSTLLLMLIGVVSAFVATNTGEAAYDVIDPDEVMALLDPESEETFEYQYEPVADKHGEQTELARNIFVGATVLYAIVVVLAFVSPKTRNLKARVLTHLVVLVVLAVANVVMANAAHLGGELVHRWGVRSALPELEEEAVESDTDEASEEEPASEETPTADEQDAAVEEPSADDETPAENDAA